MTDIPDEKNIIQVEEAEFRAPVSESLIFRMGATNNFINNRIYSTKGWDLNNDLGGFPNLIGMDGNLGCLFNMEIAGFMYRVDTVGSSGTITWDIHRLTGGNTDAGTIFSTKPSITTTATDGEYTLFNQVTSTTLSNPTGHTLAVLSTVEFDEGDALRFDLDTPQTGYADLYMSIMWRPR